MLTGEETKEYNKLFVDVIGSLRELTGEAVLLVLRKKLLGCGGTIRHWPTDGEVIEKTISRPMFKMIKPRLFG